MKALIIVDVQNDFCKGGALAVAGGEEIIPGINSIWDKFDQVITTQDWHPANHGSFASNHEGARPFDMGELDGRPQVLWPDHCVQGTHGAELHKELKGGGINFVKGTNKKKDTYSGFHDDDTAPTGLTEYLHRIEITEVFICGLATDYCVKFTALDAVKQGFDTRVIKDLCRGVNVQSGDSVKAVKEMKEAGIQIVPMEGL